MWIRGRPNVVAQTALDFAVFEMVVNDLVESSGQELLRDSGRQTSNESGAKNCDGRASMTDGRMHALPAKHHLFDMNLPLYSPRHPWRDECDRQVCRSTSISKLDRTFEASAITSRNHVGCRAKDRF